MKFCVKCGNEIEEGFMFCPECGTKVVVPTIKNNDEDVFGRVKALFDSGKEKEAFDFALIGFKNREIKCVRTLGLMYKYGWGTEVNLGESFRILSLPELNDDANACMELSDFYLYGNVITKDVNKALELLEKSISLGSISANYMLGYLYGFSNDIEKNIDKAKKHLKNALQGNYEIGRANYFLCLIYKNENNDSLALDYAKKAEELFAEDNDDLHINVLNVIFELLLTPYTEQHFNSDKKSEILENDIKIYVFKGAEKGIGNIQGFLAEAYKTGEFFVEKDLEQYVYWLKKSAESGFASSQYDLALLYLPEGTAIGNNFVEKNTDEFLKWLTKAVEQGNENAIMLYADLCCKNGNKSEAVRLYFTLLNDWEKPENAPMAKLKIAELFSDDRSLAKNVLNNPSEQTIDELITLFVSHAVNSSEKIKEEALCYFIFVNGKWIKKEADVVIHSNNNGGIAQGSKMPIAEFLDYVQKAAQMERGLYCLKQIKSNISNNRYKLRKSAEEARKQQSKLPPSAPIPPVDKSNDEASINHQASWMEDRHYPSEIEDAIDAFGWLIPVAKIGKDAIVKHKISKNKEKARIQAIESLKKEYEDACKNYVVKKSEYERQSIEYKRFIQDKIEEEKAMIFSETELAKLETDVDGKIQIAERHIQKFYSPNILHPEYRGLIPVSMFCKYIESGRCDTVKECINTYVSDLHHKEIVSELQNITSAVYAQQQAIYDFMSSVQYNMEQMTNALYDINNQISISNQSMAVANYNLQVQTECQKHMNENLDAIKWYEDWKFIKSYI